MTQQTQQQHPQSGMFTNLRDLRNLALVIEMYVALTLMVFQRKRVGYRRLTLGALFGMTAVFYVLNAIGNFHVAVPLAGTFGARHQNNSLEYFGFAFLAVGLWQRRKRWQELLHGEQWHTRSLGVSYLDFLPIRQDRIQRLVDPAVALLAGLCLRKLGFGGLGLWVMFAAMCWRHVEEYVHEQQLHKDLDTADSLLEAAVQHDAVAHFEGQGSGPAKARSLHETGGIPTAADASLEAQIAKRKREAAAMGGAGSHPGVRQ